MLVYLKTIWQNILDLLYPPVCLSCLKILENSATEVGLCADCLQKLEHVEAGFVQEMILNRLPEKFLNDLIVFFFFNETIQSLIHNIKYNKMAKLGKNLGRFAARNIQNFLKEPPAFVFPIPLHPAREKERGYNQSDLIARGIFESLPVPILKSGLFRTRETHSQTRLNREERQKNVKAAFQVNPGINILDKTIVLVDDVVTTGSTLNSCAEACKRAGAERVIGVALATPKLNPDAGIPENLRGSV